MLDKDLVLGGLHIGVDSGVARSTKKGNARASMCRTSNCTGIHAFSYLGKHKLTIFLAEMPQVDEEINLCLIFKISRRIASYLFALLYVYWQ